MLNKLYDFLQNKDLSQLDCPDVKEFINYLITNFSHIQKFLQFSDIKAIKQSYAYIKAVDTGGFSHGKVADCYGANQLDPNYFLSRQTGYEGLCQLLQRESSWHRNSVLLDCLAGNGTLFRIIKAIYDEIPEYVGT